MSQGCQFEFTQITAFAEMRRTVLNGSSRKADAVGDPRGFKEVSPIKPKEARPQTPRPRPGIALKRARQSPLPAREDTAARSGSISPRSTRGATLPRKPSAPGREAITAKGRRVARLVISIEFQSQSLAAARSDRFPFPSINFD